MRKLYSWILIFALAISMPGTSMVNAMAQNVEGEETSLWDGDTIELTVSDLAYQSGATIPEISIKDNDVLLVQDTDYTVQLVTTAENIGEEGAVLITGSGLYESYGEIEVPFTVIPQTPDFTAEPGEESTKITVTLTSASAGATYYEIAYCPESEEVVDDLIAKETFQNSNTVYLQNLTENTEYNITMTAVTEIAGEDGGEPLEFRSDPTEMKTCKTGVSDAYNLKYAQVEVDDIVYAANVNASAVELVVKMGDNELKINSDYTVSVEKAPVLPGDIGRVLISGSGQYTGTTIAEYQMVLAETDVETAWGDQAGTIRVTVKEAVYGATSYLLTCTDPLIEDEIETVVKEMEFGGDGTLSTELTGLTAGKMYGITVQACYKNGSSDPVYGDAQPVDQAARPEVINKIEYAQIQVSDDVVYQEDMNTVLPQGIEVILNGSALYINTDYTVAIVKAASLTEDGILKITGKGNYEGEQECTYSTVLAAPEITAEKGDDPGTIRVALTKAAYGAEYYVLSYAKDDSEDITDVEITDFSQPYIIENLETNVDYNISVIAAYGRGEGNEPLVSSEAAEATSQAELDDAYNLENAVIDVTPGYYGEGDEDDNYNVYPSISVSIGGADLEELADYELTYPKAAKQPGETGTWKITGNDPYYGTKTGTYMVTLLAPEVKASAGAESGTISVEVQNPVPGAVGYKIFCYAVDADGSALEEPYCNISLGTDGKGTIRNLTPDAGYVLLAVAYWGDGSEGNCGEASEEITVTAASENPNDFKNAAADVSSYAYYTEDGAIVPEYELYMHGEKVSKADYTVEIRAEYDDDGLLNKLGETGTITFIANPENTKGYTGSYTSPDTFEVLLAPSAVKLSTGKQAGTLNVSFQKVPGAEDYYIEVSGDSFDGEGLDITGTDLKLEAEDLNQNGVSFELNKVLQNHGYEEGLVPGMEYEVIVRGYAENPEYPGDVEYGYFSADQEGDVPMAEARGYEVKFEFRTAKGVVTSRTGYVPYGYTPDEVEPEECPEWKDVKYEYTFSDWTYGGKNVDIYEYEVTRDKLVFKAAYEKELRSYTIKFQKNGGKSVSKSSIKVDYGKKYGTLPTAKRAGYTFDGWYTKAKGGSKVTKNTKCSGAQTVYAQWTKVSVGKGSIKKLASSKKKQLTVTINKISGAKGYQVRYSLNKNMKDAKNTTVTKTSATIKKLASGKTYYVQVRAYKVDSSGAKVYGAWSSVNKKIVK